MAECNNYEGLRINPTPSSIGNQYAGVSTSDKPTGVPTYSIYLELDTGKFYYYDGAEWNEIPCACGGGGDEPSSENFKISLDDIPARNVGFFVDGENDDLQFFIDAGTVTIDSDNIITFPANLNGISFKFEYIGTIFSYGISDDDMIEINEDSTQSDFILIEPNTMYIVKGTGK